MSKERPQGARRSGAPPWIVQPAGWVAPRGYTNGIIADGRIVAVAGQVGWNPETAQFESDDFAAQASQALRNVVAVLRAAGAEPHHLVRLTWFVTDRDAYLDARRALGRAYGEIIGDHYPPMSLLIVSGLVEARALLEIEATAVVPM